MAKTKLLTQAQVVKFASLYVNGPAHLAGNWQACEAELELAVSETDPAVRRAIESEGGSLATLQPAAVLLADLPQLQAVAESEDDWKKLARLLEPIIRDIAEGAVKATAAQSSIIKHILDRAYGRVTQVQAEKRPAAGVIILPTLGAGSQMLVCPRCKSQYQPPTANDIVVEA